MRARDVITAALSILALGALVVVSPSAAPEPPAGGTDAEVMVVPGGTAALLAAARLPASVEPARACLALARELHGGQPAEVPAVSVTTLEPYLRAAGARGESGSDRVPALLPKAVWEQAVFNRTVAPADLAFSILRDRRAALVYVGLFSLDPGTLDYFAAHPALIASLYYGPVGPFGAVAESLTVRAGQVVLPGGAAQAQEWEKLVGAPARDPARFLPALLGRDGGRLAWLFDTLASLDEARLAFALQGGLGRPYDAFGQERWPVDFSLQPFRRPPLDLGLALATIGVDGQGRLAQPRDQRLWNGVFNERGTAAAGDEVSGPWLLRALASVDARERRSRLEALLFAQRVFGTRGDADRSAPALQRLSQAISAFRDHSALMLTFERLGFSDPVEYVNAARTADLLASGLDRYRATLRVAMFEGALAIVARLSDVGTIEGNTARELASALLKLPTTEPAPYGDYLLRWIEGQLLPSLPPAAGGSTADADGRLLDGLAGVGNGGRLPVVEWEDYVYRVDGGAGERSRLRRVRERQGGGDLATLLRLRQLRSRGDADYAIVLADTMARLGLADDRPLFSIGQPPPRVDAKGTPPTRLDARQGGRVDSAGDRLGVLSAELLVSYAYAVAIGDPESPMLLAGDPARTHDFAVGLPDTWAVAHSVRADSQLVLRGSLFGLERALAVPSLRQTMLDAPAVAPKIGEADVQGIAESAVTLSPFHLSDQGRDEVAGVLRRGRERLATAVRNPTDLDALAERAGMEGWRRRLMRLAAAGGVPAVSRYWSLGEVYAVGLAGEVAGAQEWGVAQRPLDGSWQSAMPTRLSMHRLSGRFGAGLAAARITDLHLRVIEWLADSKLPASLAPGVLRAAAWDLSMGTQMADPDDWLAPIQVAQALSPDRLADYVSALTANGPLVPVAPAPSANARGRGAGRSLRILSPTEGAYESGEVSIRASVEPPGQPVDRVAFFTDGRLACTVEQPPFECGWNAGADVRSHLFRVVAYLPGGQRLVQSVRTTGVDYAEPSGVEMVHVTVTVLDNGKFVTGLPREAFRVFEDGVPQPINYFAAETSPLELVVGVDVSGSLGRAIGQLRENVGYFVSSLRPADRVTLTLFNENFFVLAPPSAAPDARMKALDRLASWGSTSLYEALVRSFDLLGKQARRRGLVVFTDGDDTSSRIPQQAVERRSLTSDAVVYVIGQGRAVASSGLKDLCGRLATQSGGRAFFPQQMDELRGVLDVILEEMSHQYLVSYAPPPGKRDGAFRRIRVEVAGGYQVRTRQGYRLTTR